MQEDRQNAGKGLRPKSLNNNGSMHIFIPKSRLKVIHLCMTIWNIDTIKRNYGIKRLQIMVV